MNEIEFAQKVAKGLNKKTREAVLRSLIIRVLSINMEEKVAN